MRTSFASVECSGSVIRSREAVAVDLEGSSSGPVLHLGILIANTAGEILFWNARARDVLERGSQGHPVGQIRDLFSPDVLERLRASGAWIAVASPGAVKGALRVRARPFDSDRSLFLFFADEATVLAPPALRDAMPQSTAAGQFAREAAAGNSVGMRCIAASDSVQ